MMFDKEKETILLEDLMKDYSRYIASNYCLVSAYKYLQEANTAGADAGRRYHKELARWYFNFVTDKIFSAVQCKNAVNLYLYIRSKLIDDKG